MITTSAAARARRNSLLRRVHCAKRDMALEEDAYRDVINRSTAGRTRSAADLSIGELVDLLAEFKRLGWQAAASSRRPLSPHAHVRMIYAIWNNLKPFLRSDGGDAALRSYVQKQTVSALVPDGVSAPEFLTAAQARPVIEGLKKWLTREKAKAVRS